MSDLNQSQRDDQKLEELRRADPFVDEVLLELDRILASRAFQRAQQHARDFLRFVVREKLLGRADHVKETTIAISVYRDLDFDPLVSRKVSVAGGTLRERLERYYASEGQDDPIEIDMPLGTFVPEFRDRRVHIEVSDFLNLSLQGHEDPVWQAISDEIVHSFNEIAWIRASRARGPSTPSAEVTYWLKGCIESSDGFVRLHISLASPQTGKTICWCSFEGHRHDTFKLANEATVVMIQALRQVPPIASSPSESHRPRSVA